MGSEHDTLVFRTMGESKKVTDLVGPFLYYSVNQVVF